MGFTPRLLGPGLQQFGGKLADFGLVLLKSGMEESKRTKAMELLQNYRDELDKIPGLSEDEKEAALTQATSEVIAGDTQSQEEQGLVETAKRRKIGEPEEGVSALSMLKGVSPEERGAAIGRADVISEEITPGKPLTTLGGPTPGADELARFEAGRIAEGPAAARKAALAGGVSVSELAEAEEAQRQRIVGKGTREFERAIKAKEFRLKDLKLANEKLKQFINLGQLDRQKRKDERDSEIKIINSQIRALALKMKQARDGFTRNLISRTALSKEVKDTAAAIKTLKPILDFMYSKTERQGGFLGIGGELVPTFIGPGEDLNSSLNQMIEQLNEVTPLLFKGAPTVSNVTSGTSVGTNLDAEIDAILGSLGFKGAKKAPAKKTTRKPITDFARP